MPQALKTGRKIALYAGYGIVLVTGLLYLRFPSEAYVAYLQAQALEINPHLRVSAATVRPMFPVGLRFAEARVARDDRPGAELFAASQLRVTRRLASLLAGAYDYRFDAEAYGGRISGEAALAEDSLRGPLSATLRMGALDLRQHAYLQAMAGQSISGLLAGTVRFAGRQDRWMGGEGDADLTIRDAKVTLPRPVWNLDTVHLEEARVQLALGRQQVIVKRLDVRGRELQGGLTGTILLRENLGDSRLNLKGTVRPFPVLSKVLGGLLGKGLSSRIGRGVSFVVHGTVEAPDIKVL